jgi:hypothetical protein
VWVLPVNDRVSRLSSLSVDSAVAGQRQSQLLTSIIHQNRQRKYAWRLIGISAEGHRY